MKQVEVKILQQSYLLGCKDGQEEQLYQAVSKVDEAMTRIQDAGKVRARERIAVLAALNIASELGELHKENVAANAALQQAEAGLAAASAAPAPALAAAQQMVPEEAIQAPQVSQAPETPDPAAGQGGYVLSEHEQQQIIRLIHRIEAALGS